MTSGRTWSDLEPAPGRLHDRTFIRNHVVTRDRRILLPFQHYLRVGETRTISGGRRFSRPTNSRARSPLALWISFDGVQSWPYQRRLRDDLEGRFNYPDGFVSDDRDWLHFAFDHNRNKAIYVGARLPESPAAQKNPASAPQTLRKSDSN